MEKNRAVRKITEVYYDGKETVRKTRYFYVWKNTEVKESCKFGNMEVKILK